MGRVLSETEIDSLLGEEKRLPLEWERRVQVRPKSNQSFKERGFEIEGVSGSHFRVVLRQSNLNPLDFSIILLFRDSEGTEYRLIRFNGRHPSGHTTKWEKRRARPNSGFRNECHVHRATERYQLEGLDIDGYAEVTHDYDSFETALDRFVGARGFRLPNDPQKWLFGPGSGGGGQ